MRIDFKIPILERLESILKSGLGNIYIKIDIRKYMYISGIVPVLRTQISAYLQMKAVLLAATFMIDYLFFEDDSDLASNAVTPIRQ